jgi:hypothetical protein
VLQLFSRRLLYGHQSRGRAERLSVSPPSMATFDI